VRTSNAPFRKRPRDVWAWLLSIARRGTRDELTSVLTSIVADPPQAISLLADGFAIQNRQTIIDFAMRLRVPVISGWPVFARSGAICTYGPYRIVLRLAYFIDRILKGAKPVELPTADKL